MFYQKDTCWCNIKVEDTYYCLPLNKILFSHFLFPVDEVPHGDDHFPLPRHRDGEVECSDCFCAPCVVHENNRQLWWPERNQDPKCVNGTQRRRLYQRFWSVMKNCGAWEDARYLCKKVQAGGRRSFAVHRREIMPECVVRQCRQWLPNPDKIPYMGHKWQ